MMRRLIAVLFLGVILPYGVPIFPVRAQDGQSFPDDDPTPADPAEKGIDLDPKVLRARLSAREVKWDQKSGLLTLAYDFRKGQEKDWDIDEDCISRPMSLKGIRLAAATKIAHKGVFVEGSCAFQYAIRQRDDRGVLLSAGSVVVRQHYFNDRSFFLNDREANIGHENDGLKQFGVILSCQPARCSLKVLRSEVAFARNSAESFRFVLHGGENGGEFGALIISGKPDLKWISDLVK